MKVSYALGRVGKIRELTFLAADVNVMSQNSLNMMLQTKIRVLPLPDHVGTDMFGPGWSPRLADLEDEIITLEVESPSGLLHPYHFST